MYQARQSSKFKKDLKRCLKRGLPLKEIINVMEVLLAGETLASKYKPHKLTGNWTPFSECHIKPDWLLIYFIDEEINEIEFVRTGSHADLFNK